MLDSVASNLALGLSTAVTANNLLFCLIGVVLGTLIGVIPGLGALAAISMLFPITFHLDPGAALIMLAGIYYGTAYGGSTASILLNLPGTPSSAVACLDGHPMAKQGRAGIALFTTTIASFIGGSIGIIVLTLFSPLIVRFAATFGPAEYFSLMVMGLIASSTVSEGSRLKATAMVVFGIMIGTVGTDIYTGADRFTFGLLALSDGVSMVALAMGLFGAAELISSIRSDQNRMADGNITLRSMLPTNDDVRRSWLPTLRGSGIGAFFGALPGSGGTIASFMSYALEKKVAKDPSRFGKGAIEGVAAPEAANNSADQTAFIPTLALGIPGSAPMALILGVLIIHGISPGPDLMTTKPDLFWGLVMSFWIGNVLLLILNIPLIGVFVRVLTIPYHILYPSILVFVCIGVYSVHNSVADVIAVVVFGALGYAMRLLKFPAAPLLLGYVLGPMMEEHFRRAMILSRGSLDIFITRPVSMSFVLITLALLLWGGWRAFSRRELSSAKTSG